MFFVEKLFYRASYTRQSKMFEICSKWAAHMLLAQNSQSDITTQRSSNRKQNTNFCLQDALISKKFYKQVVEALPFG